MAEEKSGQLLIDAGPLGSGSGGHGHADALSICLVRNGRNLLIDPGTFEYVGNTGERARLRGTGAHNTMQVDGRDQAEARVRSPGRTLPVSRSSNGSQASNLICFRAVMMDIPAYHLPSFTAGGCFTEKDVLDGTRSGRGPRIASA